jgi:hypothetical protein
MYTTRAHFKFDRKNRTIYILANVFLTADTVRNACFFHFVHSVFFAWHSINTYCFSEKHQLNDSFKWGALYSALDVDIHATWVANIHVTHQASTKSPLTFKDFPTWQLGLNVDVEKSVLKIRSQVTACFISAFLSNHLPITCFLTGSKRWKSLGSILKTGLVTS